MTDLVLTLLSEIKETRPGFDAVLNRIRAALEERDRLQAQLLEHAEVCKESARPLSDRAAEPGSVPSGGIAKSDAEIADDLAALLGDTGWNSVGDAQWSRLRAALPQIAALVKGLARETTEAPAFVIDDTLHCDCGSYAEIACKNWHRAITERRVPGDCKARSPRTTPGEPR